MSAYELIAQVDSEDVRLMNANNQKIVLVKEVGNTSGTQVAWVNFSPFENNQVTWEDVYGVYSSSTEVQNGATLLQTSTVNPASAGVYYPFKDGTFGSPTGETGSNSYGIQNKYSRQFTFGMAQAVTANGNKFPVSPLNAVTVLSQQNAQFTPIEKVKIFVQANLNNGVIISQITSPALTIDLTNNPNQKVRYDRKLGAFVPA